MPVPAETCKTQLRPSAATISALVAAWSLVAAACEAGPAAGASVRIEPVPELQRAIQGFLAATQGEQTSAEQRTKVWFGHFRRLARIDYDEIIPQLLYFSMYGKDPSGNRDVTEAMALGIVGEHLGIDDHALARALLPYVKTRDPELEKALRGVGLDYPALRALAEGRAWEEWQNAGAFVRHIYKKEPGDAVRLLSRSILGPDHHERTATILWGEHQVSETLWRQRHGFLRASQADPAARDELKKLASFDDWWVRLYVAEILRQHPAFRTPDLVARLAADKHPLVQEAMSFATAKPTPSPKGPRAGR